MSARPTSTSDAEHCIHDVGPRGVSAHQCRQWWHVLVSIDRIELFGRSLPDGIGLDLQDIYPPVEVEQHTKNEPATPIEGS